MSETRKESSIRGRAANKGYRLHKRKDLPDKYELMDHTRFVLFVATLNRIDEFLDRIEPPELPPRELRKILMSRPRR
jgi:hypothetical protein